MSGIINQIGARSKIVSGNVGIGTTSPARLLSVENSGGSANVAITSGTSGYANLVFGDTDDDDIGSISYNNNNNSLNFRADTSAERMSITSAGDVRVETGDLIIGTSGKGIDFSATGDASGMTSELLDDYEEGTWEAVVTDGTNAMTMNENTGYYTKVGNLVTVSGFIQSSSLGSASGGIRITGLPFAVANDNAARAGGGVALAANLDITAGESVSYWVAGTWTYLELRVWNAAGGTSAMQASEWTADGYIAIGFSYRAA
jgi:hypothetical protein